MKSVGAFHQKGDPTVAKLEGEPELQGGGGLGEPQQWAG